MYINKHEKQNNLERHPRRETRISMNTTTYGTFKGYDYIPSSDGITSSNKVPMSGPTKRNLILLFCFLVLCCFLLTPPIICSLLTRHCLLNDESFASLLVIEVICFIPVVAFWIHVCVQYNASDVPFFLGSLLLSFGSFASSIYLINTEAKLHECYVK